MRSREQPSINSDKPDKAVRFDTPIAKWLAAMKKAGKIKLGGQLKFVDRQYTT